MKAVRTLVNCIAILLLLSAVSAAWASPVSEAQSAAQALVKAGKALENAAGAKNRILALTQTIRAYEHGLSAMRDGLRSATIRERALHLEFNSRRDQLSRLLGILQTLERVTTPMLLIHPTGPLGTARAGMMMSEITPSLQQQADELRTQLEELHALKQLQTNIEKDLRLGLVGAQQARVALSQAMNDRTNLPKRLSDDPVRTQILAENSTSLQIFASSVKALPPETTGNDQPPFAALRGSLPLPVPGTILHHFNEPDAAGLARPGLVLASRPLALVTAPTAATIRFSGPFLDYGNVVILEPSAGYLMIFSGLDEVYTEPGQIVSADEPIGLLGGKQLEAQEFLIEASEGGGTIAQETLYIEFREQGEPIDPETWFAVSDS